MKGLSEYILEASDEESKFFKKIKDEDERKEAIIKYAIVKFFSNGNVGLNNVSAYTSYTLMNEIDNILSKCGISNNMSKRDFEEYIKNTIWKRSNSLSKYKSILIDEILSYLIEKVFGRYPGGQFIKYTVDDFRKNNNTL